MEENVVPEITINDINKIETLLFWITNNVQLKIGVNTYTSTKKNRTSYYKEIQYFNNTVQKDLINVQLTPDVYIGISQIKEVNGFKADIKLNFQMTMFLKQALETIFNLLNSKYDEFYGKVGESYIVKKKIRQIEISTMFGGFILLSPDIVEFPNGECTGGVRMVLSDVNNSIVVPLSTIQTMYQILGNIDFFSYGLQMLNLVYQPEFGSNRIKVGEKKGNGGYFHK